MNKQTFKKLTAFAAFGFALFCLLWAGLSNLLLPVAEGQKDYSLMVNDPEWALISLFGLLSSLFGIFAVFGIYHVIHESGGFLLLAGTVILILGLCFEMASLTWDTFIWPVLCAADQYVPFVLSSAFIISPQFKSFVAVMIVSLFAGTICTAIALLKSKRFGKLIPWLLIAAIILYATGNFTILHIAAAGLCIYAIAFIMIGLRLYRE